MPAVAHQDIVAAIRELEVAVKEWEGSAAGAIVWRGQQVKLISQGIEAATNFLFELCDTMDVAIEARELVLAVDQFDDEMSKWAERFAVRDDGANPHGSPEMWAKYREMLAKLQPRVRKLPEPIDQLLTQAVSASLIAKIYGWYQADGTPDIQKVQQEISKPGTHYNPATWVSRHDAQWFEEIAALWAKREIAFKTMKTIAPVKREAPETVDDLIEQRVSPEQIAKMKGVDVDDVRRRAREIGIGLDVRTVSHALPNERAREREAENQQQLDEQLAITKLNNHPELPTLEERVAACFADGHTHATIARMLEREYHGLNYQRVGVILRGTAAKQPANV